MTIFILGGYSLTPWIWTLWQFSFWGLFWDTLGLDSLTIFIGGEYSGTTWIWTLWQFSFWGGILEHLGLGLSDNFHLGVFLDTSDLDSMTIFIWGEHLGTPWIWILWQFSFWREYSGTPWIWTLWQFSFGGILEHLRFGLSDNFQFWGVFWDTLDLDSMTIFFWAEYSGTPWIWTPWQFSFWGVFWDTLDLESMTIFILGGYSGTPRIWTLWQFTFWGGILERLGFGLYDNFHLRGYSGTPWIWTLWQFSFKGGILGHLRLGLYDNFHFGGVFWDTSDLDSLTIFIWGYSGTSWICTLWQFSFGGSILGHLGFGLPDNFHFGGYSGTPRIWTLWQF